MIATENEFQRCDFGITLEELKDYYKQKKATTLNHDTKVNFEKEEDHIIITKKSKSFVSAVTERRKLYEDMLKEQDSQNSIGL